MVLSEWCCCTSCKMPAIYSEFKKMLEADPTCPMCEQNIPPMTITLSHDPEGEFKALTALMKESHEK